MSASELNNEQIQGLEALGQEYKFVEQQISKRRASWPALKSQLEYVFNSFITSTKIEHLIFQSTNGNVNSEGLFFGFKPRKSGLMIEGKSGRPIEAFLSVCGLFFHQVYNGKIAVILKYPSIPEHSAQREDELIGLFEPKELNILKIFEICNHGIQNLMNWGDSDFRYSRVDL